MFNSRSGSLGSTKSVLDIEQVSLKASQGDIMGSGCVEIDNLDDARKLVRELRQKSRTQAQQIMAWRRAYKMQVSF